MNDALQKKEIFDFKAELKFISMEMKKIYEAAAVSEKTMGILFDDQDMKCMKRILNVSNESQKKRDRISTKVQLSLHNCSENVDTQFSKSMELETL